MAPSIVRYGSVSSTNALARQKIERGEIKESYIFVADYQTDGKGRAGNDWQSEPGKNLLMSWVVFPAFLSVSKQFQLSKAVSLAISDLLEDLGLSPAIKWPNDILTDQKKICGILIENSVMGNSLVHSIVGVGLNVNQVDFPVYTYQATSLRNETGKDYDILSIASNLVDKLNVRFEQLEAGQEDLLNKIYLSKLFRKGSISSFQSGDRTFKGIIRGVNAEGELILEENGIEMAYGFHELTLLY